MAEKKGNPASVAILIIIILLALFFVLWQAKPPVTPPSVPPTEQDRTPAETAPIPPVGGAPTATAPAAYGK